MTFVDLDGTQVTDLTPLAGITGLQILDLNNTQVADLTPLAGITGLQSLSLINTQVADLTPLAGITGLRSLFLNNTQVTDLTPLAEITGLRSLFLNNTQVADLTPLAEITGLRSLFLNNTQVADLTPLAGITGLQSLDLTNTPVADLTPLAGITGLQSLFLNNTQVADLTPLAGITGLQSLNLTNTQVADLTPLADLPDLVDLRFDGTPAADQSEDLAAFATIEDNALRTRRVLNHLREELGPTNRRMDTPAPSPLAPTRTIDDLIALDPPHPSEPELSSGAKRALQPELCQEATELIDLASNYSRRASEAARRMAVELAAPFEDLNMVAVYVQADKLDTALRNNPKRVEGERFHDDALDLLEVVVRQAQQLVRGNPEVEELRGNPLAATPPDPAQLSGLQEAAGALAAEPGVFTEDTLVDQETFAGTKEPITGSEAVVEGAKVRNLVLGASALTGVTSAAVGGVFDGFFSEIGAMSANSLPDLLSLVKPAFRWLYERGEMLVTILKRVAAFVGDDLVAWLAQVVDDVQRAVAAWLKARGL